MHKHSLQRHGSCDKKNIRLFIIRLESREMKKMLKIATCSCDTLSFLWLTEMYKSHRFAQGFCFSIHNSFHQINWNIRRKYFRQKYTHTWTCKLSQFNCQLLSTVKSFCDKDIRPTAHKHARIHFLVQCPGSCLCTDGPSPFITDNKWKRQKYVHTAAHTAAKREMYFICTRKN